MHVHEDVIIKYEWNFRYSLKLLTSISKQLFCKISLYMPSMTAATYCAAIEDVICVYRMVGFCMVEFRYDNEFRAVMDLNSAIKSPI